jgi:hypothetical protein
LALAFIRMVNVVPIFSTLSTMTWPPICSIMRLQILSPSPVPCEFTLECSSSFPNSMKSFPRFSFLMPTPESMISILSLTNFSLVYSVSWSFWLNLIEDSATLNVFEYLSSTNSLMSASELDPSAISTFWLSFF